GTSNEDRSRALTHEIGHYLDLQHTWGDNNDPNELCGDDGVVDTLPTAGHDACTDDDLYDHECNGETLIELYNFNQVSTTSGTVDPGPVPVTTPQDTDAMLTFTSIHASGVSDNPTQDDSFAFSGWSTGAE